MLHNTYLKRIFGCLSVFFVSPFLSLAAGGQRIEYETGYYYTIRKGDTLWDLSDRFFDDPQQWPDLWQKNREILNPHWIYPGNRIRLHRAAGSKEFEKPVTAAPPETTCMEGTERQRKSASEADAPYFQYSSMDQLGFVRKKAVEPNGRIFKVKEDARLIGPDDMVYIKKLGEAVFVPGARFTAYRTLPIGKDTQGTDYRGVQHYFAGVVEIVRNEPKYAVGVVVHAYRSIRIHDLLIPYEKRPANVFLQPSNKAVNGKIICSEERRLIFGDQTIAFIDKGAGDGVVAGQTYSIYYKEAARLDSADHTPLIPLEFGSLLVLLTEESSATVIITRSERSVSPGARFHVADP